MHLYLSVDIEPKRKILNWAEMADICATLSFEEDLEEGETSTRRQNVASISTNNYEQVKNCVKQCVQIRLFTSSTEDSTEKHRYCPSVQNVVKKAENLRGARKRLF